MTSLFDSQTIEIPCPHCKHKVSERIGRLKTNPKLTCSACQGVIDVNANQLRTEIAKIEKSLTELKRTLSRLGK